MALLAWDAHSNPEVVSRLQITLRARRLLLHCLVKAVELLPVHAQAWLTTVLLRLVVRILMCILQ